LVQASDTSAFALSNAPYEEVEDIAQFTNGLLQATPVASQFLALSQDQRLTLASFVAGQLAGYVDDAGMAVPQENHFLFAIR
jgi:conjugal transfer/entry exclusion protein